MPIRNIVIQGIRLRVEIVKKDGRYAAKTLCPYERPTGKPCSVSIAGYGHKKKEALDRFLHVAEKHLKGDADS